MPCFSWHEGEEAGDPFVKSAVFTCHPRHDGILFTTHSNMTDNKGKKFNHTQSCFFADFNQILSITNFLLVYLKEINDAKNRNELP